MMVRTPFVSSKRPYKGFTKGLQRVYKGFTKGGNRQPHVLG